LEFSKNVRSTFNHAEYVGPPVGVASTDSDALEVWKLSDGQVKYDFDLTLLVVTEDEDGNEIETESPCIKSVDKICEANFIHTQTFINA
jgi:hypothetical protein